MTNHLACCHSKAKLGIFHAAKVSWELEGTSAQEVKPVAAILVIAYKNGL